MVHDRAESFASGTGRAARLSPSSISPCSKMTPSFPYVGNASSTSSRTWRSSGCACPAYASGFFRRGSCRCEQLDDRVEALVEDARGSRKIDGSYLIGADGARSTARKALGIAVRGLRAIQERFLVLATGLSFSFDAEHALMLPQLFFRSRRMVRAIQGHRRRWRSGLYACCSLLG